MKNILRKLTLSIAFLGSLAAPLSAQVVPKGSSHINLGYEFPDYIDAFIGSFIPVSTVGPFTASYQYAFVDKLATGIQLGYLQGKTPNVLFTDPTTGETFNYSATYGAITLMVKADYHYLKHKKLDIYSGLSAGLGFGTARVLNYGKKTTSGSLDLFVWHFRPACIRYMVTENIGAFAEGGIFVMYPNCAVGLSAKFGGAKNKHEKHDHK